MFILGVLPGQIAYFLVGSSFAQVIANTLNFERYLDCVTPFLCDYTKDSYYIIMGAIKYDSEHK